MDSGILTLVISGAALVGGAIGWLFRQYQYHRTAKRQAAHDANEILSERKKLLEDMISKTQDAKLKIELNSQLEEVHAALLGIYGQRLRHNLKEAGLPTEEILIAEGYSQLQTQREPLAEIPIKEKSIGLKLQQDKQLQEVIMEAEALPKHALDRNFLMILSLAYYHAKRYEDAKHKYDEVLKLKTDDIVALTNRGFINFLMGNYDNALDDTDRAIKLEPRNPEILHNRIKLYVHMQRYVEALADTNRLIQLRPDDPYAFNSRASVYWYLQEYNEAIADYNKALMLSSDDPTILNNRGEAYVQLGEYDKALVDLNRCLELSPNLYDAIINRAGLYKYLGMYENQYADYMRALEVEHDNPVTHYNLARYLSLQGKIKEALYYLNYLKKLVGKDGKYWNLIKMHKDFDNIREDPRFKKLIE